MEYFEYTFENLAPPGKEIMPTPISFPLILAHEPVPHYIEHIKLL